MHSALRDRYVSSKCDIFFVLLVFLFFSFSFCVYGVHLFKPFHSVIILIVSLALIVISLPPSVVLCCLHNLSCNITVSFFFARSG